MRTLEAPYGVLLVVTSPRGRIRSYHCAESYARALDDATESYAWDGETLDPALCRLATAEETDQHNRAMDDWSWHDACEALESEQVCGLGLDLSDPFDWELALKVQRYEDRRWLDSDGE